MVKNTAGTAKRSRSEQPDDEPWEVSICGDLTENQAEIMNALAEVPLRSAGTLWIDSCGGSAFVGLSLAGLIRLRGLEATAVVLGECSSAALLPFAAATRRFVLPQSTLFFHPVRWSSEEEVNLEEAAEWTRHFKVLEHDLDDVLSKLFEVPLETLVSWTRPGHFFTGLEFSQKGLAQLVDLYSPDPWKQLALKTKTR